MTTCKQPKSQEDQTSRLPSLAGKGGQESDLDKNLVPVPSPLKTGALVRRLGRSSSSLITPSPTRRGLGKGYLYLLQKSLSAKSSGFTIIECLLAIILVGIMMTAIAPVIVLSVATRVQARRVEQATMAARTYIDGIQTGAIPAPASLVTLPAPPTPGTFNPTDRGNFAAVLPPPAGTTLACSNDPTDPIYPYCTNDPNLSLYCVDNGGGCVGANTKDFIVQAFRSAAVPPVVVPPAVVPPDDGSQGYLLGVRVYRADLFDGNSTFSTTQERGESNNLTRKVGTNAGGTGRVLGQANGPMIELTTEIRPNVKQVNPTLVTPVPGVPSSTSSPSPGSAMNELCARLGGCKDP